MPLRSVPWRWWGKSPVQAPELSRTLQYTAHGSCATSAHIQPERLCLRMVHSEYLVEDGWHCFILALLTAIFD